MLSAIIDRITTGLAIRRLRKAPAIEAGRALIEHEWINSQEVIQGFPPEFVQRQGEVMMEEVIKVALSPDPRMANREKLVNLVMELAQLQVLVIDPPPTDDATGLRGQLGITGELMPQLFEIYQVSKYLQELLHGIGDTPKDWDDVWYPVLSRYLQVRGMTHVFHGLRSVFDDVNRAPGKDWFKPFLAAMCGWAEDQYREALGVPEVLPFLKPVQLCMFAQFVERGDQYPDLEWNDLAVKFEDGDATWRAHSWLAKEKFC